MEAIKCEVVWSWVGKRAFLQNDLIPPTPILLRGKVSTQNCVRDSVKRPLGDKNGDKALNPLDADDKRFGKLSKLFLLV